MRGKLSIDTRTISKGRVSRLVEEWKMESGLLVMSFSNTGLFVCSLMACVPEVLWPVFWLLTPKGPETIFMPFLKFGQAIMKAIFIKNS
jgi:hypothetical protein